MEKKIYKFSAELTFAYNIFSADTQRNLNFSVTADICRDMEEMMQKSEQIALKELENAAPLQRIARAILRALAPLL